MKRDRIPATLATAMPLCRADDHRTGLTPDERLTRMYFAVHEAAHYVIACRLGLNPFDAFVRVPRKSPKSLSVFAAGGPGIGGLVSVSGTAMQDAAVAAAGVSAQVVLPNYSHRILARDFDDIEKWGSAAAASVQTVGALLDAITLMVEREWKVIDAVASCLLHCADSTGHLSSAFTARLNRLVHKTPPDISRTPEFAPPTLCGVTMKNPPAIYASPVYPYVTLSTPSDYQSSVLQVA